MSEGGIGRAVGCRLWLANHQSDHLTMALRNLSLRGLISSEIKGLGWLFQIILSSIFIIQTIVSLQFNLSLNGKLIITCRPEKFHNADVTILPTETMRTVTNCRWVSAGFPSSRGLVGSLHRCKAVNTWCCSLQLLCP